MRNEVIDTKTLACRLTEARKEAGLTQVEVAEELELDKRTISAYEKGRLRIHGSLLLTLADMYSLSLDKLIGREYPKIDGRTKKAGLLRKLEQLYSIPEKDRQLVLDMIDTLAKRHMEAATSADSEPNTQASS